MEPIRNIAIIAHVDHGKTTLVDCLLKQAGTFRENQEVEERIMDSMDLEREKGITIRAKNATFHYKDVRVNVVDTPGHADFGGEVERIMNMIDGVILVVDSVEGPQAQTRFVLRKALEAGAKPMLVINKIDREHADPHRVLDQVFDLFLSLEATDEQLDFPTLYASAKDGVAKAELEDEATDMVPLYEAIVKHFPPPRIESSSDFRMLVANLDYSEYLGRIAFGKILSGSVQVGGPLYCVRGDGTRTKGKVASIYTYDGLNRIEIKEAEAGSIVGVAGIEDVLIGETMTDGEEVEPLPFVPIDPPTINMQFAVNDGPLAGQDGKKVTARHIKERLIRETKANVSFRIAETEAPNIFDVNSRGTMQIAILVEQMRREGFEVLVSRPEVIWKRDEEGRLLEPIEKVFVEVPQEHMGVVMEGLSFRKGDIKDIRHQGDAVIIEALVPMRGLIGFETELINQTRGTSIVSHLFHSYEPDKGEIAARKNGSLVSMESGESTSYALDLLQGRGRLMIGPGVKIYPGMIVGENARDQDLPVNPCKAKKLTNMRSSGDGKGIILDVPLTLTLERALEYIGSDEYVEATPNHLRLRKRILDATERKRAGFKRQMKVETA